MPSSRRSPPRTAVTAVLVVAAVALLAVGLGAAAVGANGVHFDQSEYDPGPGDVVHAGVLTGVDSLERTVTLHPVEDGEGDDDPVATLELTAAEHNQRANFRIDTDSAYDDAFDAGENTTANVTVHEDGSFEIGDEYELRAPGSWPASLTVEPRAVHDLTVYRGPPNASENLTTTTDIAAAKEDDRLTSAGADASLTQADTADADATMAANETLVIEFEARGLDGLLREADGESDAERFEDVFGVDPTNRSDAIGNNPPALTAAQTDDTVSPMLDRQAFDLFQHDAATVVSDLEYDTVAVVYDLEAARIDSIWRDEDPVDRPFDDDFDVTAAHDCGSEAVCEPGAENATERLATVEPAVRATDVDDGDEHATVEWETTVPPWESLTLQWEDEEEQVTPAVDGDRLTFTSSHAVPENGTTVEVVYDGHVIETLELEAPDDEGDGDETPTEDVATPPEETPTETDDEPGETDDDTPGFGVIAALVALVAFVAQTASLLAVRRR